MKLVHRRCCGIDVHKDRVTACVLITEPDGRRTVRKKEFDSYLRGLENLRLWLYANTLLSKTSVARLAFVWRERTCWRRMCI